MRTYKNSKFKQNNNSDSKIEGINLMLQDMCTYVTTIIHNKDYILLYLPLCDTIRNTDKLILLSPPYIKKFPQLSNITRCRISKSNQMYDGVLPIDANIISIMKNKIYLFSMMPLQIYA